MEAFKPVGIGAVAAKNVFKLVFSEDLSAPPQLKAWDDYLMTTILHKILIGSANNGNKPMIAGIGLTAAPVAGWYPSSLVVGAAVDVASLLKGDLGFCQLSAAAPEADDELFFNINYKFPYCAGTPPDTDPKPSDTFTHVVGFEYQYTGVAPAVAAYANKGTEGAPDWQLLILGIKGSAPQPGMTEIKPCDAGRGPDGMGDYFFTFPNSGEAHPDEIWLKDYAV